ncbi:DUF1059 domain-containing protein [Natrarchaeobius chitinivorans]|uniref:DUF1059 domain-containing protein n=1 Tax=Natrarchaeobius chitinivorans TaxID=1679083 RepID=A0A3N6PBP9_NATCH|nr:DUF1059 domain-containing protein [Natrarchaeobius chitinivorans]RQG94045.1 DUF1059 domain-containing protein [Natrarchaeobius chitinivorans]
MAYQFECSNGGCQFLVRSSSSEEVQRLVRAHVRTAHRGRIAPVDLERNIDRVEPA